MNRHLAHGGSDFLSSRYVISEGVLQGREMKPQMNTDEHN